jgi:hypothetical protein
MANSDAAVFHGADRVADVVTGAAGASSLGDMCFLFLALLWPVISLATIRTNRGLTIPQQGGGAALTVSKRPGARGLSATHHDVENSSHATPATATWPFFHVITT